MGECVEFVFIGGLCRECDELNDKVIDSSLESYCSEWYERGFTTGALGHTGDSTSLPHDNLSISNYKLILDFLLLYIAELMDLKRPKHLQENFNLYILFFCDILMEVTAKLTQQASTILEHGQF